MSDIIYILNGEEISAADLSNLARAAGVTVEEFRLLNGVTIKEQETFPKDAAAEDAGVVSDQDPASALESRLEAISSELQGIDVGGTYNYKLDKFVGFDKQAKAKQEKLIKERNQLKQDLERQYDNMGIRFDKPETVINQTEEAVADALEKEYHWLDFEQTGVRNAIKLKLPSGDKVLDLKPFTEKGRKEGLEILKELRRYDNSLTQEQKTSLNLDRTVNEVEATRDVSNINQLLEDTEYRLEQEEIPGTYIPSMQGGTTTPSTYEYVLKKGDEIIADNIEDARKILRTDVIKFELKSIVNKSYEVQKDAVIERDKALEKESEVIKQDKRLPLRYYENKFKEDIIKALGDNITSEDRAALYTHFQTIKARNLGTARKGTRKYTVEEQVEAYKNLSGLPEELKSKLVAIGFNEAVAQDGINNLAVEELGNKSETIAEEVLKKSGKQNLIKLSQRFIGQEEDRFREATKERVDQTVNTYSDFSNTFFNRAQAIIADAPEGTKFDLKRIGGSTQLNLAIDRQLTKEEQAAFDKASDELMDLQYVMGVMQKDYVKTLDNINQDIEEYYVGGGGVDVKLFNTAAKEFGLGAILAKDVNDSFANFLLTVPTLLNSEWASLEQKRLNDKNQYFETMLAYDDGDFLRYALRTSAQQSANIAVAIGTAGAGSGLGLSTTATQLAVGSVFGVSSGTQTFRDLTNQQELYKYAELKGKQAERAYATGVMEEYEYTQIMQDVNNTLAMGKLTDNQILGASFSNGVIEGVITSFIGKAPNAIKLTRNFKTPSQLTEIAKNLYKSNTSKIYNYIGKPLVLRPAGEVIEETSIFGLQQYLTEYAILDRDIDILDQLDDVAMAAITVSGVSQSPGIAYSGMVTYGKTKQYERKINKLRINNQNLSQLIQDTKNDKDKKSLLFSMTENLKEMNLETDMLSVDILNLGADKIKRLIGNSLIKQDLLAKAGVPPGSNDVKTAEILNAYKKTLSSQELEVFNNQLNAIDTQISNIKNEVDNQGSYDNAKEYLGGIYDQYDAKFKREGRNFKTDREKIATIIQEFRQDMVDSNLERAKSNQDIIDIVENTLTETGGRINEKQKDAMYADFGKLLALNESRGIANQININTAADLIFEKGSNIKIVPWKTEKDLEQILAKEDISAEERADAFSKLKDGKAFGLIVGNKIITQNEEQAREDLEKGEVRAGTVVLHELAHAIDDGRITTKKGKLDYANNLFKAASTSKNKALQALHNHTMELLNKLYGPKNMTFENSETFRDEYTKYLQEQAFAFEDELQLEKDENALVRAFNDLTTNANSLNTPQRALNYMLANNSAFRKGKLSRKSQQALKTRKPSELKFSEQTLNEDAKKYQADKEVDIVNFFDQYKKLGLKALGYSKAKGDIATDEAISFIMSEFPSIIKNFKPKTAKFSTYATDVLRQRGQGFYKQELSRKEGTQRITAASEATRLVAEETAEAGIELEEREAAEAKAEVKLINPLSAKEVSRNKKEIEDAVNITKAMAPIADFKSISQDFGGKVASIIFNVPETKIVDGTKNLTYAKKIVDGIPEASEAGNIQNMYSDLQTLARDIKLLPDTNVTSEESRVGPVGEKVTVTRDVQGRSLGLPNRIIKYFYEDTGKRSRGTTSQTKVYRKKKKFNNPTPQVLKEVQREMGITPARQLNNYDRTIGQFLKGFAKVKGSVAAVAVAKNKIAAMDLKTAKGKKQIEADIGAGRSRVQLSEKVSKVSKQAIDLSREMKKASEAGRLIDSPVVNQTLKALRSQGLNTIADIKNKFDLPLKPGDDTKDISKSGYRVLSGQVDLVADILNEFLETNPKYYETLKDSLTGSLRRSIMGAVPVYRQKVKRPKDFDGTKFKRQDYKQSGKLKKTFVEQTKQDNFLQDQYSKLKYFEEFWKNVETFLNKSNNMSKAWVFQEMLVDAVNNMNSLTRISPPILYLPIDANGNTDFDSDIREEHNFPSNNVGTLMLWAAMNGQVDNAMKVVSAAYMQGPILMTDDKRIDATSVEGEKFTKKLRDGLAVNMPDFFWDKVVPRIVSGDLVIPEGLAAVTRLTASNVNLDSYKFLPENMTMSEYLFGTNGVPTETKIKGIATQNQIAQEFFSGEITLEEARQKGKKTVDTLNKLHETIKPEAPATLEFTNKADKAMADARNSLKYSEKIKKARVFDFDDTLARSKSKVIVNMVNPEGGFSEGSTNLKAIFMVGGPGAGKTNVGKGLQLGRRGYKVVNQDIALEAMKQEAGLPAKESDYTAEQRSLRSKLGAAARKAAVAKFNKYADAGVGMVIDGTGASYNATMKKVKQLEDAGYEVHMVVATTPLETALERNRARAERSLPDFVVEKTYDQVQGSLAQYRVDFGNRLYEINTESIQYGKPLPNDFLQEVYAGINRNKVFKIDATQFASEAGNLESQGATFNFSEFSKVIDGEKGPLFDVAKFISEAPGKRDMFVLTARPADSAPAIKAFLDGLGLNIPIENITGLADGKPQAKADWFIEKYSEGYNDFYFADDALKNVKAVKNVFDVLDVKSKVQQARVKFSEKLSTEFNQMIERNKGVKAEATFSDILAKRKGMKQKRFAFFVPPSADDFRGLTQYTFAGKGKQGEADQEFFDKALIRPYQRGVAAINKARTQVRNDYRALLTNNKPIRKKLKKKVQDSNYTHDEAIRVYLWTNENYEIPGLSKRDQKMLFDFVDENPDLKAFAEGVKIITKKDEYITPTEFWDASTILGDLSNIANSINRAEYLKEFIDNSKIIFSDKNLNKIEAVYGFRVRESIENALHRMETGQNSNKGAGRLVNKWNNWVNNSVGAIMFFNRRSALLQTLSTVNFINWSDNNPIKAGVAFANQPQYWKDFKTLWNSPKLVARRRGLESDIQEAEIAQAAAKGGPQGVISYLLKIGFTPTQLADSFAIASGGATFYRNRINSYKKQGMTIEDAEKRAFEDFSSIAEETQQSGDPMLISQQQASVLGRLVLAFQNTPMQYTRLIKKAGQDLINRRGDAMTNISKIVYYGFVQNLIFSTLQNALFALLPGFDDEEEEFATDKEREKYFEKEQAREEGKIARTVNSMLDTLLRGSGLAGAVVSTLKNVIVEYAEQQEKPPIQRENADILLAALSISPPIGSKARKLNAALNTMMFEKDVIAERGFDITIDGKFQLSPAYDVLGQTASATLNIPLDRVVSEVNAVTEALDTRNTQWQRIALGLGWRQWDVNARVEEHDSIKTHAKIKRKEEGKIKAKATREANKKIKLENTILRSKVLNALPDDVRLELQAKERKTGIETPVYKLKQLKEKYLKDE